MSNKNKEMRHPLSWPLAIGFCAGVILLLISYFCLGPPKETDSLWLDFWRTSTKEAGFAFLVATVIWTCFEFYKSTQEDDHWNERIEAISKNVFFGVWKKNFPDGLIKEAGRLILDQTFIRVGLHITYTIADEEFAGPNGTVKFVKLNAVTTSKVKNVSNDVAELPVGIALPNPMIDEMKPFCKLNRISIKKDGKEIAVSLDKAEAAFRAALKDDSVSQVMMPIQEVTLDPDEEVDMVFDYTMAKEFEDTEVFTTRYPTDSVTLTVHDRGAIKRVVRARAIHPTDLVNDSSSETYGSYNFRLQRYLLPQQGFVIWWKTVPDRQKPRQTAAT